MTASRIRAARTNTLFTSTLFRRLFLPYLLLTCVAVGCVGLFGILRLRSAYLERTEVALRENATLVTELIDADVRLHRSSEVNAHIARLGRAINCRITIVDETGVVIADNEADPSHMDNHLGRPEIVGAMRDGTGSSRRDSGTLHESLMYFARRAGGANGASDGNATDAKPYYVRLAVHLQPLNGHLRLLSLAMAGVVLATMLASAALCFMFVRRQTAPLVDLIGFANALSHGDLSRRVENTDTGEMRTLAAALNTMADALARLVAQTNQDKAELLAIITSMTEGVIAVDCDQRILLVNTAAAQLLRFDASTAQGANLFDLVHSEPILRATDQALSTRRSRTIRAGPIEGRHLECSTCAFPASGHLAGAVLVIHDATESVRYQELRKEFVANVSHELRTPLTAIKGFAETLRDGAMQDPDRGMHYLTTIEKHADQLTNLVNDLLEISRLENQATMPRRSPIDVGATVRKAVELLRPAAEKKSHAVDIDMPNTLPRVVGNSDDLERAIANLVDNAIKYTPRGGSIRVRVEPNGEHVTIDVSDNGIGIPEHEVPRIFERFYRVDRSRSREMGGTGLGLSIIKHVAQAHGGSVHVASTPGKGSTFSLKLPIGK